MTRPLAPPLNSDARAWFGDLAIYAHRDQPPTITAAPPLTRIHLGDIATAWYITVDDQGINIANQVWYTPIEVDPAAMELVCRKTRDQRPLTIQSREEEATHNDHHLW